MKKTIKVPDYWDEITLGQFQEIASQDKESKDYSIQVVSILLDKDPEEIRKYNVDTTNKIMRHIEWVMKYPREDVYKQEIEVEGITYRLIENLNRFSNGEWFDMEDYMEDLYGNLHYLFAMFYRPTGEEYNGTKCKARGRLFAEKVMIGDLYGALVFFSNVAKKSMLTTQDYLTEQILKDLTSQNNPQKKNQMQKR